MKAKRVCMVLSTVMLVILVSTIPATAETERIEYTGTICITSLVGGETWTEGNVLHQRDVVTSGRVTSSSPYMTGEVIIIQNADINQATGNVHAFGTVEIIPDGYEGSWVGHWSTHVFGGVDLRGSSTAHGTGELAGMIDFNNMMNPANPSPDCWMGGTDSTGYIMITP